MAMSVAMEAGLPPAAGAPAAETTRWREYWQQGNTPWNLGRPAPALAATLRRWPVLGRCLVPGCGHGHEASLLQDLGWDVVGLDCTPEALAAAQQRDPRPSWCRGDILNPPPGWCGSFDLVVEHTCFCALPPRCRDAYGQAVGRLLRPGGHLLGLFWCHPRPGGPPFGAAPWQLEACFAAARLRLVSLEPARQSVAARRGEEWLGHWWR